MTHETRFPTGQSYSLGIFSVYLKLSMAQLKELGEEFFVIGAPKWMFEKKNILKFSDYALQDEPKFAAPKGKEAWRSGSTFKIKLKFKDTGSDTCTSTLMSTYLSANASKEFRYGLAYSLGQSDEDGIILFQGAIFSDMHCSLANLDMLDAKRAVDKVGKRRITWAGVWQPDLPWDGILTLWRLPRQLPYLDSHLHIQSNHTAPLPLVWDKFPASDFVKALEPGWETKGKNLFIGHSAGAVIGLLTGNPLIAFGLGGLLIHQFRSGQMSIGLDDISKLAFGESGEIATNSTDVVGSKLAKELLAASKWKIPFYPNRKSADKDSVWALATPLPMDMEYGHFRGYFGETIYRKEKDGFSFSLNPFTGERGQIQQSDANIYEGWERQKEKSKTSARKSPFRMLPLFHLDPRRYRDDGASEYQWDEGFDEINTESKPSKLSGPFIGVKTYTSLGYMPKDPLLPWQDKIYDHCEANKIPIVNHCTVQGMYTHEKPFYYDLWDSDATIREKLPRWDHLDAMRSELKSKIQNPSAHGNRFWARLESEVWREKCRWFERHYIYPSAWEPVIKSHPNLKLCLAHFCGYDFWGDKHRGNGHIEEKSKMIYGFTSAGDDSLPDPNGTNQLIHQLLSLIREDNQVYADLSFFFFTEYNRDALRAFFKWAHRYKGGFILNRILWGTDWPLLVTDRKLQLRNDMMRKYLHMNFQEISAIDPELWIRFTILNPARFYSIREIIPHLKKFFGTEPPDCLKSIPYSLDEFYSLSGKMK